MKSVVAAAAAALLLLSGLAHAVETENDTPPTPTNTTQSCSDGTIWDEKTESCVAAQESRINDDMRFDAARELAYAGRYDEAASILASADNPNDPRILNYKGFTSRKLGDIPAAMTYYRAALDIDPDYVLARSYMGQALIEDGRIEEARAQLEEIRTRAGRDTWAYVSLKQALQGKVGY